MAAPVKRSVGELVDLHDLPTSKKQHIEDTDEKLNAFLDWCDKNDFKLSKKVCYV